MGCCCSTRSDEDVYENAETCDKANLLGYPGDASQSTSVENDPSGRHSQGDQTSEQDKFNQILQKTANSYIDVPALNSPIEQPDIKDWEKMYGEKVKEVLKRHQPLEREAPLLADIPQVERILAAEPLSTADKKLMDEASSQIVAAMESIKVDQEESIVTPFPNL